MTIIRLHQVSGDRQVAAINVKKKKRVRERELFFISQVKYCRFNLQVSLTQMCRVHFLRRSLIKNMSVMPNVLLMISYTLTKQLGEDLKHFKATAHRRVGVGQNATCIIFYWSAQTRSAAPQCDSIQLNQDAVESRRHLHNWDKYMSLLCVLCLTVGSQ